MELILAQQKRYIHELFQRHIHKVKFYPSADNFTQALLVANIMSGYSYYESEECKDAYWFKYWLKYQQSFHVDPESHLIF